MQRRDRWTRVRRLTALALVSVLVMLAVVRAQRTDAGNVIGSPADCLGAFNLTCWQAYNAPTRDTLFIWNRNQMSADATLVGASIAVAQPAWNTTGVGPQLFETSRNINSGHNFIKPVTTQQIIDAVNQPAMALTRLCNDEGCSSNPTVPKEYEYTEVWINIDTTYVDTCYVCVTTSPVERHWVLTHELGHVLGLAHHGSCSDSPPTLMCDGGLPPGFSFPYPSSTEAGSMSDCKMGGPFDDDGIRCIFDWYNCGSDIDCDLEPSISDNCTFMPNETQLNRDGEILTMTFQHNGQTYFTSASSNQDKTFLDADVPGDICDIDDDGDGRDTVDELSGTNCGAFGATDPLEYDSDYDKFLDGVECLFRSNPNSSNSKPTLTPDADADGLSDGQEILLNTNVNVKDTDGDGMQDGMEVMKYGSNPLSTNTDGALCADKKESASVNNDYTVNVADRGMVAQVQVLGIPSGHVSWTLRQVRNADMNKDGAFNVADTGWVGTVFGYC